MAGQIEILDQTYAQLWRPIEGQVRFSDVFAEVAVANEEAWWRKTDFDSGLTDAVESSGFPDIEQIPIGLRPWLTNYGLILTDDLVRSRYERVAKLDCQFNGQKDAHPDIRKEIEAQFLAVIALANYAPRDNANTDNGNNGSDFYLAITGAGVEIYATPLTFLSGLEARNRITSLYRIPTKGHPEFDGDHEQFRSARVIRTRRHPDHLEPIFEYTSQAAVIEAKRDGSHPAVIPVDTRTGSIAFVDKFGNIKLELADTRVLRRLAVGKFATLQVSNNDKQYEVGVQTATDLRTAPLGKLAVYFNCSDHKDTDSGVGLVELAARVDDNPSTSSSTAIFQLLEQIPDLDPGEAEVQLVV